MKIACVVEGHGEVSAVPILLRRLVQWRKPERYVDVLPPIRVSRDRFLRRELEFHRHLMLAAAKCGETGWILVLLDADDDCPAKLGADLLRRAQVCVPHRSISVVLANKEYEAWFIAAGKSLDGVRGFASTPLDAPVPESYRDAKGWMKSRMSGGSYGETTDQAAFTAQMDFALVFERSRSFRKLCKELDHHLNR